MPTCAPLRPPRHRAAAVAAAVAIGLTGCSSTEPERPAAPGTAPGTTGTTAPAGPLARYAGYLSVSHDERDHWVCRPEVHDLCQGDLDSTVVRADGTTAVERFEAADDPPVDCFYVYPTISRDDAPNSDWSTSLDEEGWVTLNQAARLRSTCRLFVPVYRQMTLKELGAELSTDPPGSATTRPSAERPEPYADVLDAFRTYMARDNDRRPLVLVGHSQGASVLQRLVREEIDPHADVRAQLLVAFLGGWPLAVPPGRDVGGEFEHVPLCRAAGQTGCVFSWSSYRSTAPPPADPVYFAKPRDGRTGEAACNTPANLRDGDPAYLQAYFPADSRASILTGLTGAGGTWLDPARGAVATPFVTLPGLLAGTCMTTEGFHYLSVTVNGDPADPRADDIPGDLTPPWGLHLDDMNLVMGDMVDWVKAASAGLAPG